MKVGQRIPESKQNVFLVLIGWPHSHCSSMIGFRESGGQRNSCAAQFSPYHLLSACHVVQNHEATTHPQIAWPLHRKQGIRKLSTFRHMSLLTVPRVVDAKFHFLVAPKLTVVTPFLLRNYRFFLSLSPHPPTHPKIFSLLSSTVFYVSREWVGPHLLHI